MAEISEQELDAVAKAVAEAAEKAGYIFTLQQSYGVARDVIAALTELQARRSADAKVVERIGAAIEKAKGVRRYGMYDFSSYPGDAPPYRVVEEFTGKCLLATGDRAKAKAEYERLNRALLATAALQELSDMGLVVVPEWPTPEMIEVGIEARWQSAVRNPDSIGEIWTAMLTASKVQP